MKKIIPVDKFKCQADFEKIALDSIFPKKYQTAIDCSSFSYVDEFEIDMQTGELSPPCTNRGGIKRSVVESTTCALTPPTVFSCIVDYLSITFALSAYGEGDNVSRIETFVSCLSSYISQLKWASAGKGLFGYKQSAYLTRNDLQVGLIGFDGNNDSCYLSLSGQGCTGVDMADLRTFVESLPGAKITRIDLAHDDLEGSISVHDYKKMYESGDFTIKGTAPKARFMDDLGSGTGCTLYVGKKVHGKEACIYEKGRQLGDESSTWVRVEGRITSVDRIVPFEVMTQPAQYLAALYPPFALLSAVHCHIKIILKHLEVAFDNLLESGSIGYGKLINYMSEIGFTDSQIVAKMRRPGRPKRLTIPDSALKNMVPF